MQLKSTVYLEDVFVLNLIMNLYLLRLSGKLLGKKVSGKRILAGSLLGAAGYCGLLCIPVLPYGVRAGVGMILLALLMVKLILKTKGIRELLYAAGWLFTLAFLLGGFILFLRSRLHMLQRAENAAAGIAGAGFFGYEIFCKEIDSYRSRQKNHFCKVRLQADEGELTVMALIDTGNGLTEPVSKKPVAILEEAQWQKLKRWMRPEKYKIIPYHSIGCDSGFLEGYEIESIRVEGQTGTGQYEGVIIAILKGKISKKGGYQMILPPELSL